MQVLQEMYNIQTDGPRKTYRDFKPSLKTRITDVSVLACRLFGRLKVEPASPRESWKTDAAKRLVNSA